MLESKKVYINTKRFGALELTRGNDGLLRDAFGTVYAVEDQASLDPVSRCGIAPFVIPVDVPQLEAGCKPHDYMHSSTAYQVYHTMHEANLEMLRLVNLSTRGHWSRALKTAFYFITELSIPFMEWRGKKK